MERIADFLWVPAAYLIGSIPTAYLTARWAKGVDIRTVGSGNPGATNVFRSVGKTAGVITLILDALKGWAPVWLAAHFVSGDKVPVLCGLAAVAGHTWPLFLGFRGGKGVATSAGVFAALLPWAFSTALAVFIVGLAASRHVSVGSLAAAVTLPAAAFWKYGPVSASWLALAVGLLVLVRHTSNIKRLLQGKEISVNNSGGNS